MHEIKKYISKQIAIPSEFKDVFTHFYVARNNTSSSIQKVLLPTYQSILVFNFGKTVFSVSSKHKTVDVGKCLLLGLVKQPINYVLQTGTELFVVNFKADAFYRFFGQVIGANYRSIDPDKLVDDNCFTYVWKQLKDMDSAQERAEHLLEFCRPYLQESDDIVQKFITFNNDAVIDPIKAIAAETNQSKRNVQLKHKKYLGYSGKEIARYQRFLKTIELLQQKAGAANKKVDWLDLVEQNGYYDQSHLIHDFNHFLNITPSQYLGLHQHICVGNSSIKSD